MRKSIELAARIRLSALRMVSLAQASHIGGALSMSDILAVLYGGVLIHRPDEPYWPNRDRVILSKGHSCAALYAALAHCGYFPVEELDTYAQEGSRLMAHISHKVPGVEFSTGSLGHGLPFGVGKALAAARRSQPWRTYVIVSDGELDEGSNWEAILFAPHHRLSNLVLIVDFNKIQSLGRVEEVVDLGDLGAKFRSFGWEVREGDGHDHDFLSETLTAGGGRPRVVIAHTVKGKGVSFMENQLLWHYRSPDSVQLQQAEHEVRRGLKNC